MNSSKGRGSGAVLCDLRCGIEIHSQIARDLLRISRGLDGAERCFHLHIVAVVENVGAMGHPHGKEGERRDAKDSPEYDYPDDDQNGFESTIARGGRDGWSRGS